MGGGLMAVADSGAVRAEATAGEPDQTAGRAGNVPRLGTTAAGESVHELVGPTRFGFATDQYIGYSEPDDRREAGETQAPHEQRTGFADDANAADICSKTTSEHAGQ